STTTPWQAGGEKLNRAACAHRLAKSLHGAEWPCKGERVVLDSIGWRYSAAFAVSSPSLVTGLGISVSGAQAGVPKAIRVSLRGGSSPMLQKPCPTYEVIGKRSGRRSCPPSRVVRASIARRRSSAVSPGNSV